MQQIAIERRKQFVLDSTNSNNRFTFDSKSLQTQINTLNETRRNFEKEHKAFLDMDKIDIQDAKDGINNTVIFGIENIGTQPVITDKIGFHILTTDTAKGKKKNIRDFCFQKCKSHLQNEQFYFGRNAKKDINQNFFKFPDKEIEEMKAKNRKIFIGCLIHYKNVVTDKTGTFLFYGYTDYKILNSSGSYPLALLYEDNIPD